MTAAATAIPPEVIEQARSGMRNGFVWPVLPLKQLFNERWASVDEAFATFRQVLDLPADRSIVRKPIRSLVAYAEKHGAVFTQTSTPGRAFVNRPPTVIGEGDQRILTGTTRTGYVAQLRDVWLRGRSSLIDCGDALLHDYEGDERARVDEIMELDSSVMRADGDHAWVFEPRGERGLLEVDEAFNLLGVNSRAFGHWFAELLPKYAGALRSGTMPSVPVLIDCAMPKQHRQSLEMMLDPGATIIEVGPFQPVHVQRLWCAPTPYYCPVLVEANERFRDDYVAAPPDDYAKLLDEMRRRMKAGATGGPPRILLVRKPRGHHRNLVNQAEIEAIALARGFAKVFMEDHPFAEQVRLIGGARHIIGPEGSALMLAFLAPRGAKLCVLNHPHTVHVATVTALMEPLQIESTLFTGPFERVDPDYAHFSDYRIDAQAFASFLDGWLSQ